MGPETRTLDGEGTLTDSPSPLVPTLKVLGGDLRKKEGMRYGEGQDTRGSRRLCNRGSSSKVD